MPDFVQTTAKDIEDRLRALKDETSRLEAALTALSGGKHRPGRPARNGTGAAPRRRRGANTRAIQALELVRDKPGITIPEIAKAMKIEPNYLYRVLPRLAADGQVKRDGQGWLPSSSSKATRANAVSRARTPGRTATAKSNSVTSATRPARSRRRNQSTSTSNGRGTRGATKASVLAALAGGQAMTAGQVATKAGLARPTVSTTLSKLAKTGEVQKASRGYRLGSTA